MERPARCTLRVEGLDCPHEVSPIRGALEGAPGVLGLDFDPPGGTVAVSFDPGLTDPTSLTRRIRDGAGMAAEPVVEAPMIARGSEGEGSWRAFRSRWGATGSSGLALAIGAAADWSSWAAGGSGAFGWEGRIALAGYAAAVALGAVELLPKAWRGVRQRRLGIHLLMTLAILGAIALGEWGEAATVAFLFGLAEALEAQSLARARRAVRSLLEVAPETAELIEPGGGTRVVPADAVGPGRRVRVRAGDRVPIDGRVVSGRSSVDQKAITGESVPVDKGPGDEVFAGTVNGAGALDVEATRPPGDSVVARTAALVREAQGRRMPLERSIERFAAVYTPMVVVMAALVMDGPPLVGTMLGIPADWREWFLRGLVVLVVACPCALVIGTPVAVVSALASSARRGVLVKGGQFLEAVGRLRVFAFDKTGTLTRGEPSVVEVVPAAEGCPDSMLRVAAALGDRGGHVLGRAIARHAREMALAVPDAEDYLAQPGLGATGTVGATRYHIGSHRYIDEAGLCDDAFHASLGDAELGPGTAVALSAPGGPLGWIRLADRPRPEAAAVLAELATLGLRTVMLTGDNPSTAAATAAELGLADHRAGLLPADKAEVVSRLDALLGPTGMVGDGVNDAPALAEARVSVALGGISSAVALEAADVVLMADDLRGLPWLVRHSRRTLRVIRQNIALAIGLKLLVLALAVLGLADLWMAIAADVGTTLVVVANALRLLRPGDPGRP
ncbi:heavy metal translocating P-type ATPase [Tautonia plasticadhaerens]|uniref:P-type Zn(2+) transporter n=1 Tax=Tautonia plasticadhaerens TaxID=2527974 RepID=A0A518H5A8_9BACT|nr:cation-translocating P-type ATPase [Tautonia plasticadhaerens]QDV36027.1 putative cadmium-transporting ATPase [Tautonia plasticadhaerens]